MAAPADRSDPGAPSAARRRLTPEQRAGEIVDAATQVFAARPYASVTIGDIAQAAGVSRGLVTHYFGDKAGVFLAVAGRFASEAARSIAVDTGLEREAMVAANVDAVLRFLERHRETVLALLPGSSATDPRVGARVDAMRDAIAARMLSNQFPDGDVPPGAHFEIRAYTGLFAVAVGDWLRRGEPSRDAVVEFLGRTLLAIVADLRERPRARVRSPRPRPARGSRSTTRRPDRSG